LKNFIPKIVPKGWQFFTLLFIITIAVTVTAQAVVIRLNSLSSETLPRGTTDEPFRQLLYLPAPTPRVQEASAEEVAQSKRPPSFYDEDKAPPDDAPVEDLVDYWERWAGTPSREMRKPSAAVRERLLAACEAKPEMLSRLLPLLSDTTDAADRIKKLYDAAQGDARFDEEWRKSVKEWLQVNSKYFLSDLLALSQKAKDKEGYVDKEGALKALAKVDWESAAPLLQSMSDGSQPRTAAFALALLYRHALKGKDSSSEEKYRALLQAIATDRNAPARARDTAIEELSLSEWPGRDEWYLSLFSDQTLLEPTDGHYLFSPLTTLFDRDPDKWIPVMAKLVESKDRAVQQNAASCLVRYATDHPRREAILPVLRWLSDPDWLDINGTQRAWFMQTMDELEMPESVPGLIWIVENEEGNRQWAARTLAHYKDPRAIPALKKALAQEKNEGSRQYLIQGLLASGGVTATEQLAALEAYASKLTTAEGSEEVGRYRSYGDDPLPLPVSIGRYLAQQKEAPDNLVRGVLERAERSQEKNPSLARALLSVAQGWQARQVDLDMLRRINAGTADTTTIANALERRAKLRQSLEPELQSLVSAGGTAQGVVAVLLADESLAQTILASSDEHAQLALLACARLVQMPLPVQQVDALLKSKNTTLSLAAERYLLAEDSREARAMLLEHHPQQAFITGWRENIQLIGGSDFSAMGRAEEKLRGELFKKTDAPSQIIALLGNDERPLRVLRIYPNMAVYTHNEDASRYRERVITTQELASFKNFVTTNNLTELGPQIGPCHHDCWVSEFLSLTRQGGRRVFSHQGFGGWITLLANFDLLGRGAKVHYRLEDKIKGLEVLLADETLSVREVWKRNDDLRVLVEREETADEIRQEDSEPSEDDEEDEASVRAERRRLELERAKARLSWRSFSADKLGAVTSQPEGFATFDEATLGIDDNDFPSHLTARLVQATAGGYVVLAGDISKGGLWKKASGRKAVRISGEGVYANPIVTPDGIWVVAARADTDWGRPNGVIRFNLKTGREYRVNLPPAEQFEPVAYLSAHGKVLLRRARDESDDREAAGPASPEFYLLDVITGQAQLVKGVFEPLLQEGNRFLQPTGVPDEFWAAAPDHQQNHTRVGRYSLRDFSFQTLLVVPHLTFDSTRMWIDEARAKVYIVYDGQLLRLPLKSLPQTKASER
jgi:hypothetical protein